MHDPWTIRFKKVLVHGIRARDYKLILPYNTQEACRNLTSSFKMAHVESSDKFVSMIYSQVKVPHHHSNAWKAVCKWTATAMSPKPWSGVINYESCSAIIPCENNSLHAEETIMKNFTQITFLLCVTPCLHSHCTYRFLELHNGRVTMFSQWRVSILSQWLTRLSECCVT